MQSLNKNFQEENRLVSEKRTQLISDIFNGIQVVKLYGWEEPLEKQVEEVRQEELRLDQFIEVGRRLDDLFRSLTPFLVPYFCHL